MKHYIFGFVFLASANNKTRLQQVRIEELSSCKCRWFTTYRDGMKWMSAMLASGFDSSLYPFLNMDQFGEHLADEEGSDDSACVARSGSDLDLN